MSIRAYTDPNPNLLQPLTASTITTSTINTNSETINQDLTVNGNINSAGGAPLLKNPIWINLQPTPVSPTYSLSCTNGVATPQPGTFLRLFRIGNIAFFSCKSRWQGNVAAVANMELTFNDSTILENNFILDTDACGTCSRIELTGSFVGLLSEIQASPPKTLAFDFQSNGGALLYDLVLSGSFTVR